MSVLIQTTKDLEKVLAVMKSQGVAYLRVGDAEIQLAPQAILSPRISISDPEREADRRPLTKAQKEALRDSELFNTPRPNIGER